MTYHLGLRRPLLTLIVMAALTVLLPAAAQAATDGPVVNFQANGVNGPIDGNLINNDSGVQLPPASISVQITGDSSFACYGDGLSAGNAPGNTVAALLQQFDAWTNSGGDYGTLTFEGTTANLESLNFNDAPNTYGWDLWIEDGGQWNYSDLGQDGLTGGLCQTLNNGDQVVLQDNYLNTTGYSGGLVPDTPLVVVNLPQTVSAGDSFTATIDTLEPPPDGQGYPDWEANARNMQPVPAVGYYASFDGETSVQADSSGDVTFTPSVSDYNNIGVAQVVAAVNDPNSDYTNPFTGTKTTSAVTLPTGSDSDNSAFSLPTDACFYGGSAAQAPSNCTGSVGGSATAFTTQAIDTLSAPQYITLTPAAGVVQITGASVSGNDQDAFVISSDSCTGNGGTIDSAYDQTSPPPTGEAATCAIGVRFAPWVAQTASADLNIATDATNATGGVYTIPLSGSGGSLPTGPTGAPGSIGTTGLTGAAGATGAQGKVGPQGKTGPRGKAGENAVCIVKRAKKAPKVTCKLEGTGSSKTTHKTNAKLVRDGRTVATGTLSDLKATRKLKANYRYTLRFRQAGRLVSLVIRLS
jgi:hypothetical protein